MFRRNIQITDYDKQRIDELLLSATVSGKYYEELEKQINAAEVVSADLIDADVITMNTQVRVTDLDTTPGSEFVLQLVFPGDADIHENKISVLSPAGTALLGNRVGNTVSWYAPEYGRLFSTRAFRNVRIEEIVYQPSETAEELYF